MRLIVISLGFGLLLYGLAHNSVPAPTLTIVGLFIIASSVVSRLCGRLGIPPASGAMLAGLIIAFSSVLSTEWAGALKPFSDVALSWLGICIGSAFTRTKLTNKRLLLSAGVLYLAPAALAFTGLLVWGMSAILAARIALLAGISAPFFMIGNGNVTSESLSLSLLVTATGLLLWSLTGLPAGLPFVGQSPWMAVFDLLVFALGIELAFRTLQSTRTEGSRALALSFCALLLTQVAWTRGLNPLPIALFGGALLSLRGATAVAQVTGAPFSKLITAFALAVFGFQLLPEGDLVTTVAIWPPLLVYCIAAGIGKIAGGLIAKRILRLPVGAWLPLVPQGFLALICFGTLTQVAAPDAAGMTNLAFFACFCVVLPMATSLTLWFAHKWKNGRHTERTVRRAV